jgi:hypothetical protein
MLLEHTTKAELENSFPSLNALYQLIASQVRDIDATLCQSRLSFLLLLYSTLLAAPISLSHMYHVLVTRMTLY